jgi:hypothetical protein
MDYIAEPASGWQPKLIDQRLVAYRVRTAE